MQSFLPHTNSDGLKEHRAKLMYLKTALSYWRDHVKEALEIGLEAEKLAREVNDKKLLANILAYLGGNIYRELNELDKAKTCLVESIALCRETNHPTRLSIALTGLSAIAFTQSEMDLSQKAIEESMQIALEENDLWGQSYALRVKADHLALRKNLTRHSAPIKALSRSQ